MLIKISFLCHYVVTIRAQTGSKNVTIEKIKHIQVTVHQVVYETGLQAHLKSFDLLKI